MVNRQSLRAKNIEPTPPATLLTEIVIPASGCSKTEIAKRLGVSRQTLYDVLNKKNAVSPDLAARLGKLFGNGTGFWIRMQAEYDIWKADQNVDVSHIETLTIETLTAA
ncbi:HigA family addiction module antitoxin [Entomobacter blattae]|uniref:Putative HTH-type transcriptional regulator YbaQ n=1 Tax=Entomobacter blattae TaxID=2762277 RepID=A0A7H1NTZ0_9PROT|nr:HigA family addiction module antitoxin [Entomobacter blattae]QNT79250.1 putative HTH-type transcriptional regulator YbaQ [Entomobacter blattae]